MKRKSPLTDHEIMALVKRKKGFWVATNNERKDVLKAAGFSRIKLATKKAEKGGFDVLF